MTLFQQAQTFATRTAIISEGRSYTYQSLLDASHSFASELLNGSTDLSEARVAFMVNPGFDYVKVQWGIWRSGGIAVPLCITHPFPSLQYVIEDTESAILVVSACYAPLFTEYLLSSPIRFLIMEDVEPAASFPILPTLSPDRRALILYTSGTTNLPKGVVTTHQNLHAQIQTLQSAWQWTSTDHILCVLPLHHVHGIVNVVSCSLWAGATCSFMPSFDALQVFEWFKQGAINVFMAVPTIYYKLIAYWEQVDLVQQQAITSSLKKFRLMVCGSAALPVSVMEKWELISGHRLLERYGMTEIGMAISNPYQGDRRAGYIGQPLPGVDVMLADEKDNPVPPETPGEILVRGENVFKSYWNRPAETAASFTAEGWFKTGDVAVMEDGYYRIMGRQSVDIIKSGGYKISALEIEEELRKHPQVADVAVVGIPDDEWGERIVAAVVVTNADSLQEIDFSSWLRERIPAYKVPRLYKILTALPRNAMGKVIKNDVKKMFES
jgi:malonyl-CoA/methylmalonyl-CoA synthetase